MGRGGEMEGAHREGEKRERIEKRKEKPVFLPLSHLPPFLVCCTKENMVQTYLQK